MSPALFAALLLLAPVEPPASSEATHWGLLQISARGATGSGEFQSGVSAGAQAGLTLLPWRRLVDDGTPIPYQPFLQRLSTVRAFGGLEYLSVNYNGLSSPKGVGGGGGLEVEYYATPEFVLQARADASITSMTGPTGRHAATDRPLSNYRVLGFTGGLGYRTGNVLVDLRYRIEPTWADGALTDQRWGSLTLRARTVFRTNLAITAEGTLMDGGGVVAARAEYFFVGPGLGLFARFAFGHGRFDTLTAVSYDQLQLTPGAEYWLTRRLALEADYHFEFNATGLFQSFVHALRVGIDVRL